MCKVYILDIEDLKRSARQEEMLAGLNLDRQTKIRRLKQKEDRLRSLAAGLLLQYGLWKAAKVEKAAEKVENVTATIEKVTTKMGRSATAKSEEAFGSPTGTFCEWISVDGTEIEKTAAAASAFCKNLTFATGAAGKPYVEELPVSFNLSHSANKVICGVSGQEIGVDIQVMRDGRLRGLWNRYFVKREKDLLEECRSEDEQKKLFYQMWVCKEAYGKLTGAGLWTQRESEPEAEPIIRVSPLLDGEKMGVACELHTEITGYMAAVCVELD